MTRGTHVKNGSMPCAFNLGQSRLTECWDSFPSVSLLVGEIFPRKFYLNGADPTQWRPYLTPYGP